MKYKLKVKARIFFDDKFHTSVEALSWWENHVIGLPLLDEVNKIYVEYGHEASPKCKMLKGWSSEGGIAHFPFTVNINEVTCKDHEEVDVCEVMDEIQKVLDKYFKAIYY